MGRSVGPIVAAALALVVQDHLASGVRRDVMVTRTGVATTSGQGR